MANAILDGTDCRDALGRVGHGPLPGGGRRHAGENRGGHRGPPRRLRPGARRARPRPATRTIRAEELIAASVEATIRRITPATVIVPTHSGATARSIARFRLPVWITAVSSQEKTCQDLMF
ncbi:MAG: hypothetical protein MZU95_03480, partial [Desulfomicrobium escambiense]|nr:hypothetical protein [Desulfomicrobium escambiense]